MLSQPAEDMEFASELHQKEPLLPDYVIKILATYRIKGSYGTRNCQREKSASKYWTTSKH